MLRYNSKLHTVQIGSELVNAWSTPPHPPSSRNHPSEASLPSPSGGGGGGRDDAAPLLPPTSSLAGVFEALERRCERLMPMTKKFGRVKDEKGKKVPPKEVEVTFNVDGGHKDYISFINKLREELGKHNDPESKSCFERSKWSKAKSRHILLPKQTAPEPARWIMITLTAKECKTTLFVRDDNVYLAGFENKKGQKYQAGRGWGGQSGRTPNKNERMPDQILKDAIPLGYDLSYDDLGGDSSKWNLNQDSIRQAVFKLSAYGGTKENSKKKQECIKKYLARLIVFICEAARMYLIMATAEKGWNPIEYVDVYLEDIERQTLNKWAHISRAMMWGGYATPDLKKIKVENDEQAGAVVYLIKYAPMRMKPGDGPPGDGNGDGPPGDGNGDAPPGDAPGDGNGDGTLPRDGNYHGAPSGGGSGDGTSSCGGNGETLNERVHISQAMMRWSEYTPALKKIKVENDGQAGDVVHLIKYAPKGIKPGDGNGHGTSPGDGNGHGPPGEGSGNAPPGDGNGDALPGDGNGNAPPGDGNGLGTSSGDGNRHRAPSGGGGSDGTSAGGGSGDPPSADRNSRSQQRRQEGRSLVELCSIHLSKECTLPDVTSITVFDGERSQVIYLNKEDGAPRLDSEGNLVLTGPYRAISADGMVALRIPTISDSDTEAAEALIWDPYAEDAYEDIDNLLSGSLTKDEDLKLTYAVLSSAVEATVQIDLFLFQETDFFGKITAHSKLPSGEEVTVVLFSREIKDRVVFMPWSAGSTIPLTRSVLAWAIGPELRIEVACFNSIPVSHCGLRLWANVGRSLEVNPSVECLKFSSEDHTRRLHAATLKGFGYVRVGVDDTGEYREKMNNSLPRSLEQTLAAERNDLTSMRILESKPGDQNFMDPEANRTNTRLLVVRTSKLRLISFGGTKFFTCLLDLTNDSVDQDVAFRCRSVLQGPTYESEIINSSGRAWELSGIVPRNSTSTYLLRPYRWLYYEEVKILTLLLDCCAAGEGTENVTHTAISGETADEATSSEDPDDKTTTHLLDTIFHAAKDRIERVTLQGTVRDPDDMTTTHEQAEGDEDLCTFFSRSSNEIKEFTIKGTFSNSADVPMTSETETKGCITESLIGQSDLDIYPLQLCFPFKQDKVICCPLRLTNRTDYYVMFMAYNSNSYLYTLNHLNGILPPMSTCTYIVAIEKQKDLPDNKDALSVILKSCTAQKIRDPYRYISRQEWMHELSTPMAISDKQTILPRIEIMTVTEKDYDILSMDVHPTEPWILASHVNGSVSIWNYQTQARVIELGVLRDLQKGKREFSHIREYITGDLILSAKFIAREKWIVAGTKDGLIYVVSYTKNTEVSTFKAHKRWVRSLAVHPSQRIVSASLDETIVLWNWDANRDPIWEPIRRFSGHSGFVSHVMFNPYDNGDTFASASYDHTVKIWRTNDLNDQPKAIAILKCGQDLQCNVAYFSMGGRQYIITGSFEGSTRVWDLEETNKPIKKLDGPECIVEGCNVGAVNCVPDNTNPVLITVSGDKGISFLDASTYEPRYEKVNFGLREAVGFAVIEVKGKRSLAIVLKGGIAIMEMNDDPVNSPATVEPAQGIYAAESSNE